MTRTRAAATRKRRDCSRLVTRETWRRRGGVPVAYEGRGSCAVSRGRVSLTNGPSQKIAEGPRLKSDVGRCGATQATNPRTTLAACAHRLEACGSAQPRARDEKRPGGSTAAGARFFKEGVGC